MAQPPLGYWSKVTILFSEVLYHALYHYCSRLARHKVHGTMPTSIYSTAHLLIMITSAFELFSSYDQCLLTVFILALAHHQYARARNAIYTRFLSEPRELFSLLAGVPLAEYVTAFQCQFSIDAWMNRHYRSHIAALSSISGTAHTDVMRLPPPRHSL